MYRIFTFIFLISAITVKARTPRILDGDIIKIEKVPYQASLTTKRLGHICGGSIISKDYILTAAHCAAFNVTEYIIRVGSNFSDRGGEVHKVTKIIQHEKHDHEYGTPVEDIALMKITPPINIDNKTKRPIKLFDKLEEVKVDDIGLVAGWGRVKKPSLESSKNLLSVYLNVIDKKTCLADYKKTRIDFKMSVNTFCAVHPAGIKNSGPGDSGGPFVIKGKQAGIVSWGLPWNYEITGIPSVYVDVAKYHDWIHQHVKLPSKL